MSENWAGTATNGFKTAVDKLRDTRVLLPERSFLLLGAPFQIPRSYFSLDDGDRIQVASAHNMIRRLVPSAEPTAGPRAASVEALLLDVAALLGAMKLMNRQAARDAFVYLDLQGEIRDAEGGVVCGFNVQDQVTFTCGKVISTLPTEIQLLEVKVGGSTGFHINTIINSIK